MNFRLAGKLQERLLVELENVRVVVQQQDFVFDDGIRSHPYFLADFVSCYQPRGRTKQASGRKQC